MLGIHIALGIHIQGLTQEEDQGRKNNPEEARRQFSFGIFYLKNGEFWRAEQHLHASTQFDGNFRDAWLRLGEARERLDRPGGAVAAYVKYLRLAPEAENASAIREKIKKLAPRPRLLDPPTPASRRARKVAV